MPVQETLVCKPTLVFSSYVTWSLLFKHSKHRPDLQKVPRNDSNDDLTTIIIHRRQKTLAVDARRNIIMWGKKQVSSTWSQLTELELVSKSQGSQISICHREALSDYPRQSLWLWEHRVLDSDETAWKTLLWGKYATSPEQLGQMGQKKLSRESVSHLAKLFTSLSFGFLTFQ